jgi:hypothetical protein
MPKPKSDRKKSSERVLALEDLEQAKAAVLDSLTSASGQRTYDHAITEFVAWYCSEPRLAFIEPWSSGIGFTSNSNTMRPRRSTCGWPRSDAWRTRRPTRGCSVPSWLRGFVA